MVNYSQTPEEYWSGNTLYRKNPSGVGYTAVATKASSLPTTTPTQPQAPTQVPVTTPQTTTQGGIPPVDMSKYAGWTDQAAIEANWRDTWQEKTGQGGGGMGISTPETINLPELYKSLDEASGVSALEKEYSDKEKAYNEAMSKINDNPFLSEASRVGRQQKLSIDFQNAVANLQKDIATKKADIETQLNLQTKQFDINSQVATNALNQLNSLLSMGALDNATGDTIANLTRSTGISSDLINSAIQANKAKNVKTQVITSTAENGEVFAVVLNTDTGEIIKKTSLGVIGNVQGGGTTTSMKAQAVQEADTTNFPDLVVKFANVLSLDDLYAIYMKSAMGQRWGKPTENPQEIKLLYKVARGEMTPQEAEEELGG